jgi:hypothetical protein
MGILAKAGAALQRLFGDIAQTTADESGVIQRKRKFTGLSLARTFVLGFLWKPKASDEELAQIAVQCGTAVTPQAVEQRHTPKLVAFLEKLFRGATALVVGSGRALAPLLERFTQVTILDSSTITLPDDMQEQYRGCGGSYGGGAAAVKLQTELELRSGALSSVTIEPGRSPDGASARQQVERPGAAVDVLEWLSGQPGPYVDAPIRLGGEQLSCRLLAWRLPEERANRRRQKLRKETLDKRGHEPSAARLAWCDWTILVTNVPGELLTPPEAVVLYRARWQVELLFKRWKSQGLVAALSGSTAVRQMVRVWSRLLAALVQHWLVVASAWGDASRSWVKVSEVIRLFVGRLLTALDHLVALEQVLADLGKVVGKTCQRNKRSKPGTVELLNDVSRLEFR